jgi:HSP20 family protein
MLAATRRKEGSMANLIRRREREPGSLARGWDPLRTDPFQMMRDLLRWDPFREMERLGSWSELAFSPDVEFKETKDAYIFKADLPGVQEKDLDISVTGNRIHISGKREEEETREDDRYYAYERSYGGFSRSFTLPEGANADDVTAELKDGVLTVRVPKRPEVQPRRISVQSAQKQLEEGKGKEKKQAA